MDLSSHVALAMGRRELAADLATRAVKLDGDEFRYLAQQAKCYFVLKRYDQADPIIASLAERPAHNAAEQDALGNLYSLRGDQANAAACFKRATDLDPDRAHHWLNLGLSLQSLGELETAEQAFDRCIALDPHEKDAWLHRSRLRKQSNELNHVEDLERALSNSSDDWRREMTLRYALAKEFEDLGEYARSFEQLRLGSGLRRSHMNHDPQADVEAMTAIRCTFGADYFLPAVAGCESERPIFVVGLPRTGTTLVERILGSHTQVFAAGELNSFAESLTALVAPRKPTGRQEFIRFSAQVDSEALGRAYMESTQAFTGGAARFVDKLPLNFLYCGLIYRALPRARIIHVRRDPMDACYAIYKTLFKQAYPYSYDLEELGNYYLAYRELMDHWRAQMPGVILDVDYEALVADPEAQTHRLLDYCGLSWEEACLDFHRNEAPSMTASLAQVRMPVYTSSVGRWRLYEKELAPLQVLLQRGGVETESTVSVRAGKV
jgi:tetratricopeptide (TPR) repeat protein